MYLGTCILVETEIYRLSSYSDLNFYLNIHTFHRYLDENTHLSSKWGYFKNEKLPKIENTYCAELINGWLWKPLLNVFQTICFQKQREVKLLWETKHYSI